MYLAIEKTKLTCSELWGCSTSTPTSTSRCSIGIIMNDMFRAFVSFSKIVILLKSEILVRPHLIPNRRGRTNKNIIALQDRCIFRLSGGFWVLGLMMAEIQSDLINNIRFGTYGTRIRLLGRKKYRMSFFKNFFEQKVKNFEFVIKFILLNFMLKFRYCTPDLLYFALRWYKH